jgi:Fic family protein
MLIKYGFNVQAGGRVLNPTAVFCNDRNAYYAMLSEADTGTDEGLEKWCLYVLGGIRNELEKVDRLTQYSYLQENPASRPGVRQIAPAIHCAGRSGAQHGHRQRQLPRCRR